MRLFRFFKENKLMEGITESTFTCKREALRIRGTQYRPRGEKLPIAIVCHGFMAWQDSVKHYASFFAEMGYVSFCFDFNGGSVVKSRSDGKTTDMSVLTEVKDLEAVLDYVRTLPYVDPDHIVLMGCSQGGFVSAIVAAKNKYPIGKLCLFYPAFCIPDDARAGKMQAAKFDPANIPETFYCGLMKLGKCYVKDVLNLDPYEIIKTYNGKVLLLHGSLDKIVPIRYAEQARIAYLSTKLEGLEEDKRIHYYVIEGGAHGFSKAHDAIARKELRKFASLELCEK